MIYKQITIINDFKNYNYLRTNQRPETATSEIFNFFGVPNIFQKWNVVKGEDILKILRGSPLQTIFLSVNKLIMISIYHLYELNCCWNVFV